MIQPKPKKFISPNAQFQVKDESLDFTVGDFWQWAYSDLQQNNIRGILAEFIVAKALNIPLGIRHTWDDYDLKTPDGVKIEIKSGAYLQSWQQKELSKIIFTGLCGQVWDHKEGSRSGAAQYRANIYIFAVQKTKTHDEYNPLDFNQWEFYVLPKRELEKRGTKSMSLTTISKLTEPVFFNDLRSKIETV